MTNVLANIHSRSGADSNEQFVGGLLPAILRALRVQLLLVNGLTPFVMVMLVVVEVRVESRLVVISGHV